MGLSSSKRKWAGPVLVTIVCAVLLAVAAFRGLPTVKIMDIDEDAEFEEDVEIIDVLEGRAGLADYFAQHEAWGSHISREAHAMLENQRPLAVYEFGDLIFTVAEVVADEIQFFVNVIVELKPGLPGMVLESPYWPAEEGPYFFPESGKGAPVYYIGVDGGGTAQFVVPNADGSISWMEMCRHAIYSEGMPPSGVMPLFVNVLKDPPAATDGPLDWTEAKYDYTAHIAPDIETKQMTGETQGEWLHIESLTLRRTPITTYCTAVFSLPDGMGNHERAARLGFLLLDAEGKTYPVGFYGNYHVHWLDGDRYRVTNQWDVQTLPDAVTVQVVNRHGGGVLGQAKNIPLH
ncbi:MAG: hypothetical protein FWD25_02425 [Clostridia bacterium]|nr:hypothetical protein [Clostridia bacterium]